jgi:hypothetical protein
MQDTMFNLKKELVPDDWEKPIVMVDYTRDLSMYEGEPKAK